MASLVLELQRDALVESIAPSTLLRKALVVARKLGLRRIPEWIDLELKGYFAKQTVPNYRVVRGEPKAWNPFNGWIPVVVNDPKYARMLSRQGVGQPVAELEQLARADEAKGCLKMSYSMEIEADLRKASGLPFQPVFMVSPSSIHGILDAVRNLVLEWTLLLEKKGVLGEGMTFSDNERNAAQEADLKAEDLAGKSRIAAPNESTTINIGGSYVASMVGSQIQHDSDGSTQTMAVSPLELASVGEFLSELRAALAKQSIPTEVTRELAAEVMSIDAQLQSPKPKRGVVIECLKSIRNILEGTAGSLIASGLISKFQTLFP